MPEPALWFVTDCLGAPHLSPQAQDYLLTRFKGTDCWRRCRIDPVADMSLTQSVPQKTLSLLNLADWRWGNLA